MLNLFNKNYFYACLPLLINDTLEKGKIDQNAVQIILAESATKYKEQQHILNNNELFILNKIIEFCITYASLNISLSFRDRDKLALILGAGIGGLAASFEALKQGYKVLIAEKRSEFDRFNVINIDAECQQFLDKMEILDEFENTVAGRIQSHKIIHFSKSGCKEIDFDDVSQFNSTNTPITPETLRDNSATGLFNRGGIYSVRINDLQKFLAAKLIQAGVHIFANIDTEVIEHTDNGGINKIALTADSGSITPIELNPNLTIIAEGAHSTHAQEIFGEKQIITNECSNEHWIFGNAKYQGANTFVVSVIDTRKPDLKIANIIFNAQIGEVNIAVTSQPDIELNELKETLISTLAEVIMEQKIPMKSINLLSFTKTPVQIVNAKRNTYSRDNVLCVGDAAAHSSPLAGMGGTLCLTVVPRLMQMLWGSMTMDNAELHQAIHDLNDAAGDKWINKSLTVKGFCLSLFKNDEQQSCKTTTTETDANNLKFVS